MSSTTTQAATTTKFTTTKRIFKPRYDGVRPEWYECWAEEETTRKTGPHDPNIARLDRLHIAANDFRQNRPFWPKYVRELWDQIRLFTGLLSDTPIWQTREDAERNKNAEDDYDDEYNDNGSTNMTIGEPTAKDAPRLRPRPPYAIYGLEGGPIVEDSTQIKQLIMFEQTRRLDRSIAFLNSPAHTTAVFLSSYMRSQSLIYYSKTLIAAPRLLHFWYSFLLRNKVFPEVSEEQAAEWEAAVRICEVAMRQLPLTATIAKVLPGDFSRGCSETFMPPVESVPEVILEDEFAWWKSNNVSVVQLEPQSSETKPDPNPWTQQAKTSSLFAALGLTSLGNTHERGTVEKSVRKIIAVHKPNENPTVSFDNSSAGIVEAHLLTRYARVVLEHWPVPAPVEKKIERKTDKFETTVQSQNSLIEDDIFAPQLIQPQTQKDLARIIVLVEPELSVHLELGMGIASVWAELARVEKGQDEQETYWFMNNIEMVVPSFHTT